jgi:quercetin dioxygenase-like cupin family protein
MDTTALAAHWQRDGYLEVVTRQVMPNISKAFHAHPFDARGLILAGELTLTWQGQTHTFRVGETFDMPAGCMHSEQYGPEETIILLGRRYSSAGI